VICGKEIPYYINKTDYPSGPSQNIWLSRICLIKHLACGTMFSQKFFFLINLGCIRFEISYSVYQFIDGVNDSREAFKRSTFVDMFWVTRRDRDSGEQWNWIKQSLPQRYVCVGCQLNRDQALRLLCLKGYVGAPYSTLWIYCWQKVSEFLCITIPHFFGGS